MPRDRPGQPARFRPRRRGAVAARPGTAEEALRRAVSPASASRGSTAASGLPIAYQKAFDNESRNYELPVILNTPTFTICAATILDTGTEEQKRQHISAALRGDEVLVQLLSEPSGGSDLAGVITRADRKGDKWVINGAKTWSTSAFAADYGLMLARTDWDVPKHEGLTMFLVPINSPGITLRRIKQVNGSVEFCEEFFDNLELGDDAVVGEVNGGWHVASRQLYHERRAVGGGSEFASGIGAEGKTDVPIDYVALLQATGQGDSERAQRAGGPRAGAPGGARAADRPRVSRCPRRLAAAGGGLDHPGHPRRDSPSGGRHRAGDRRQLGRRRRRRRPAALRRAVTCRGRPPRSAAAPPRSPATSSANACSAFPASTPPTAACRSIRSSATRA